MKTISLFLGLSAERNDLTGPKIHRAQETAKPRQICAGRDASLRSESWENLAFVLIWLGALVTVGYCLTTVLSLNWPS